MTASVKCDELHPKCAVGFLRRDLQFLASTLIMGSSNAPGSVFDAITAPE